MKARLIALVSFCIISVSANASTVLLRDGCELKIVHQIELVALPGVSKGQLKNVAKRVRTEIVEVINRSQVFAGCCSTVTANPMITTRLAGESPTDNYDQISVVSGPVQVSGNCVGNGDTYGCTQHGTRTNGGWLSVSPLEPGAITGVWSKDAYSKKAKSPRRYIYAHEIGHMMGLSHSDSITDTIMSVARPLNSNDTFGLALQTQLELIPNDVACDQSCGGFCPADCASPIGEYSECTGNCSCGATPTFPPTITTNSAANECGQSTSASIFENTVNAWNMQATLSSEGTELVWPNGSIWVRSCN